MRNFKLFFENISSALKEQVLKSSFFREIRYMGGRIYFVGGFIRDFHLNMESKDIDLIVSNMPHKQLLDILKKHGEVNEVGESFGVLKFVPREFEVSEPIDIALPRTERPMTQEEKEEYKRKNGKYPSAYQAFKADPDHTLGVESDLQRRDFTINAIAQDHMGNNIDPHGGVSDISKKVIRMVSPRNFSEDPLRMLRGVQFASRFPGFKIESKTFEAIRNHAELIKGIPGERILVEIEKIVTKGNQLVGAKLLCETNLWQEISNLSCFNHDSNADLFSLSNRSKTVSEFLFLMTSYVTNLDETLNLAKRLKCDLLTEKQIRGLYYAWDRSRFEKEDNPHIVVFNLNKLHPSCLKLLVLPRDVKESIASDMPKSVKDLKVNGNDLMSLGFKGENISSAFSSVLHQIFNDNLSNSKDDILRYLSRSKGPT